MVLVSTTKQSDLERFDRVDDLALNFGWSVVKPDSPLSDKQRTELDEFLDLVDSQVSSKEPIPESFWRLVRMNGNCLRLFRDHNRNDAKALAIVLMPHLDAMYEWIAERAAPSPDDQIEFILSELQAEYSTLAGALFAETVVGVGTSLWFGRKADQEPYFTGSDAIAAARLVFGVEPKTATKADAKAAELESKAAKAESNGAKAESAKGKAKQPKLVAKKEQPLIAAPKQSLEFIDIDCIESDPENDRKTFDKAELQELADSIKRHGVLQPINLRPIHGRNAFMIVAGERRWRAAKMAGLKEVPAQISDREGLQVSLARLDENLKRVDLSPIEKAQGLKRLMDAHGLTQKEVGEAVGVQQGQVSNMLRLLNLPESLQKLVADGKIAPTFIRVLLPYCDLPAVMDEVTKIFVKKLLHPDAPDARIELRDVEQWLRNAVVNHSRPMKYRADWSEYSPPSSKDRHFSKVSDENLKLLAPRKIDVMNDWEGKERTFNVKLFTELNKTPLANRLEKHKAYKAKRGDSSGSEKAKSKTQKPFEHEWKVEQVLQPQMSELLASAIDSTKPSSNRQKLRAVVLALAMSSGESIIDEIAGNKTHFRKRVGEAATKLDCSPADCDRYLQTVVVKDLRRDAYLDCATAIALAKMLGVDLVAAWAPTDALRNALTDHGRQLLAEAGHGVPEFLMPFFGIEKKAAKAKKGTAA